MNSWIPYGVTNFADPLSKRVDEHKRQIEEDYQNKIIQSKQIEEADPGVTNLKTISGILDFGKVAAKYGRTTEKNAKAKQTKLHTETNNKYTLLASSKDSKTYLDRVLKYNNGVREIDGVTVGYEDLVKGLNVDKKLVDWLRTANPKEILRIKESRIATYADEVKKKYVLNIDNLSEKDRLEWNEKTGGNYDNVKDDFLKFAANDLAPLGITDELLVGSGSFDTIKKHAETIAGLDLAAYNVKSLTTEGVAFQEKIDLAISKKNVNGNSISQVVQAQINNEGKDTVLSRLALAASTSNSKHNLNHIELSNMRNGFIVHPAGDIVVTEKNKHLYPGFEPSDDPKNPTKIGKGELLFKSEEWARLTKLVNTRNAQSIKIKEAERDLDITNSIALANKGQLTEQGKQNALVSYLNSGGSDQDDLYKDLSNLSLNHQTAEYYKAEYAELMTRINDGQIETVMADIDKINNNQLKLEFQKKKDDYNTDLKQSGYSAGFEDETRSDLKKVISTKIVQGESIPTGSPRTAYHYIAKHRAKIFAEEFFKGPPNDPTLASRVEQRVEAFLVSKGYGEAIDSPKAGILTANSVGEFPALDAYVNSFAEVDSTASKRLDLTLTELNTAFESINGPGENQKDKALNTKGLLLNNSELVAIRNFGFKDGKFQGFPEDVLIKAEVLGIQPSVLVRRQLKALLESNDKNDKLLVQANDLDTLGAALEKMAKENGFPDVKLRELIEKTGDKDLLYGYEHLGIKNLTPNQIQRLNSLETAIDQNINVQERNKKIKAYQELDKQRGVEDALRQFNLFVSKQPSGQTRYPNGVKREHIRWDNKTKQWVLITND